MYFGPGTGRCPFKHEGAIEDATDNEAESTGAKGANKKAKKTKP